MENQLINQIIDNTTKQENVRPQSKVESKFSQLVDSIINNTNKIQPEDLYRKLQGYQFVPSNGTEPHKLVPLGSGEPLFLTRRALQQICERSQVPVRYIESLPSGLQNLCINQAIQQRIDKKDWMIRTLLNASPQGIVARAFLSDKFQKFDDVDLFQIIQPYIKDYETTVVQNHVDPFGVTKIMITWDIPECVHYIDNKRGQMKNALIIRNSEVGSSSVDIRGGTYTMVCSNGAIVPVSENRSRIYHMGNKDRLDGAIKEAIRAGLEDSQKLINDYKNSLDIQIENAGDLFQNLVNTKIINQKEQEMIMNNFLQEADHTMYGISQAVTRTAQDRGFDRRHDMEILGADMVMRPGSYIH